MVVVAVSSRSVLLMFSVRNQCHARTSQGIHQDAQPLDAVGCESMLWLDLAVAVLLLSTIGRLRSKLADVLRERFDTWSLLRQRSGFLLMCG
jgi:hypothetical protein